MGVTGRPAEVVAEEEFANIASQQAEYSKKDMKQGMTQVPILAEWDVRDVESLGDVTEGFHVSRVDLLLMVTDLRDTINLKTSLPCGTVQSDECAFNTPQ